MNNHPLPIGLKLIMGMTFGGGAALILWRMIVSIRAGEIWLRGQRAIRSEEPALFWAYFVMYLVLLIPIIYGIARAVG